MTISGNGQFGQVRAATDFDRDRPAATRAWARRQTDDWGLPPSHVAHWLARAGELLPPTTPARVELSYDANLGLLSLDVWAGETRVFGMDDWIS